MKINKAGLDLIKQYEGLRLKSYRCAANVLTIGWGSTGTHVKENMAITQEQAEQLLMKDLVRFEEGVDQLVTVSLTENQFAALVSFSFNVGLANLKSSTLLKLLNSGKYKEASLEFSKWNKAAGSVLAGLTKRREAEKALFLKVT